MLKSAHMNRTDYIFVLALAILYKKIRDQGFMRQWGNREAVPEVTFQQYRIASAVAFIPVRSLN